MTKIFITAFLLIVFLPLTTRAFDTTLKIEDGDNPLVIKGWIGDDNSFVGNIGVTLQGAPQGTTQIKLNIYKSDLKTASGTEMIGRQSVVITGDQLTPDTPAIIQVKVNGVTQPGEYEGRIELSLPGQPQRTSIIVKLSANVRPTLTLLTETDRLRANLVNCTFDCLLAHILLPGAAFQGDMELGLEKPVNAPLIVGDAGIGVNGEQTRFRIDAKTLTLGPLSDPSNAKKYVTIPVSIAREKIPADHYTGSIYLPVTGQTNPLKVPVDFNVRSGPFWPLVVLLLSILIGRLFKFMQDKGNAIANALQAINRVEFRLQNVHPDDARIIERMLGAARDLVHQEKATEATTAANAISARLVTLGELRQIQRRLAGKEGDPAVAQILENIRQARERIALEQDENAKTLLAQIKDALVALKETPDMTDSDANDLNEAINRSDSASAAIAPLGTVRQTTRGRFRNALIVLSGLSDEFRTEATLFLARPLLWLALLIGLLALGLKTLYVDNAVFGATPFADFLGLAFWGLSSDMASRTLSGLRITNG